MTEAGSAAIAAAPPVATTVVLVVEDEPEFAALISLWLENRGWRCVIARDGQDAIRRFDEDRPDVVLLDVSLPELDGWQVLERIRAVGETPVLMVTARGAEGDRLRGLGSGADDYITKPFSFPELIARVDVALRRAAPPGRTGDGVFRRGQLVIDPASRRIFVGRREVRATPTEFRLLMCLARQADRVVSHRELLVSAWGPAYADEHHLLQVTVATLRSKLDDGDRSRFVITVYGSGYRLAGR